MLAPEFLPVLGGVGTYIVQIVKHFPKDITIHVVTPMRKRIGKAEISSRDFDYLAEFGSNVKVHFICEASDTFFYNAKFQYACLKKVPELIREEKIDLIHSHTAHMPDLLLQFKSLKTPVVTTIHTTIKGQRNGSKNSRIPFRALDLSEKVTYLALPFLSVAESVYFRKSRQYITVSHWMKNQILKQYPKIGESSISVIHNSVDTKFFSPPKHNKKDKIVLITGRLVGSKGLNYLVKAMPTILNEHRDCKFVFIGPGDYDYLKCEIKRLGVHEENVNFVGYLKNPASILEYYRSAAVYIAPTLYENLPIRILEAMSCGLPVVASNVCAIPEAIENGVNGFLIEPRSVKDIGRVTCDLLSDENLRSKVGLEARRTAMEKFDQKICAENTLQKYIQIIDKSSD